MSITESNYQDIDCVGVTIWRNHPQMQGATIQERRKIPLRLRQPRNRSSTKTKFVTTTVRIHGIPHKVQQASLQVRSITDPIDSVVISTQFLPSIEDWIDYPTQDPVDIIRNLLNNSVKPRAAITLGKYYKTTELQLIIPYLKSELGN